MKQDDASLFIEAIKEETKANKSRGQWEAIERSSLLSGTKSIQSIWSFKRKYFPDETLNNYKAQLCVHNGMQQ